MRGTSGAERIWDISRPIGETTAVWPGDTRFSREWVMRIDAGASCNVSTIRTTVHIGAHTDAPSHFIDGAPSIEAVDLAKYIGPCRVVHLKEPGPLKAEHVAAFDPSDERLLVRTRPHIPDDDWHHDFAHCGVDAAHELAGRGWKLLGIDTPSMDFMESKELAAHKTLLAGGVAILEGLDLEGVPEGRYELIALPLKIVGADASPVRAILRGPIPDQSSS